MEHNSLTKEQLTFGHPWHQASCSVSRIFDGYTEVTIFNVSCFTVVADDSCLFLRISRQRLGYYLDQSVTISVSFMIQHSQAILPLNIIYKGGSVENRKICIKNRV